MNKQEFLKRMDDAFNAHKLSRECSVRLWGIRSSKGVCETLSSYVCYDARKRFAELYKPKGRSGYWLGRRESIINHYKRTFYMLRFKRHCLRTECYKEW